MNGFSAAEASRLLGVSEPRLYRAVAKAGIGGRDGHGHLHLEVPDVAALVRQWGWIPPGLRDQGVSREEVFVLAALSRSPLGLRSARSVARRASIAPATAVRALASLADRGLARERRQRVVEGKVTDIDVWVLNWRAPEWRALSTMVARVVLPAPAAPARSQRSVPSRFAHLFWNEDTTELDVVRDGTMIAERILGSSDAEAIAWASGAIPASSLRRVRGLRNVAPQVAALADALAGNR